MLGMHGTWYANMAVNDCDLLIAVGARFDDRVTGRLDGFSQNSKRSCSLKIFALQIQIHS